MEHKGVLSRPQMTHGPSQSFESQRTAEGEDAESRVASLLTMGNQASMSGGLPGGLDCCTAVEGVGEDGDELNDENSMLGSQAAAHARSRRVTKPDRGVCHELTGESLFTECIDDRCGNRDSKGRHRQGMPAPIGRDANGQYTGGDGGKEPAWCVPTSGTCACVCALLFVPLARRV